jgi:precorrin-2 dehydrogenase/sirohydrochlorin ferrochelatase
MARTADVKYTEYYPAFLDLWHKRVVVIGGGTLATGKIHGLLPCGPEPIVVIAPHISEFIEDQAAAGKLEWLRRPYAEGDVAGADYCFAATNDREINAAVATEARQQRVPVLAIDDVPNCDFIAPAIVRRGKLVVAISTQGRSPAMASHIRRELDRLLPPEWADLLDVAAAVRERLGPARSRVAPDDWQAALDDDLKALVWQQDLAAAEELLFGRLMKEVPA